LSILWQMNKHMKGRLPAGLWEEVQKLAEDFKKK
jgi:hypothetical protein